MANKLSVHWRWHDTKREKRRVWFSYWSGNQFDIITPDQFAFLVRLCKAFDVELIEDED